ncbi:SUMO-specific isopeptidase USPL1 isoform X2 [Dendropsophus ebraccatus]|uniref:SUMO-specific isopeptidase USPL1 isoform X2 n=1 Tax=Dendropsophus ebraccatus TaxID=150705 RepID=UPI0038317AD6
MTKISQWVTTMASETPGSTVSMNPNGVHTPHDGWCPVCKIKGQTQALKTYRINFTQSIFLCSNPQCIYPLGYTPLDNIITNTADLKKNSSPNKQKRRISSLSPAPCGKRPKIDQPIFNDSQTVQADPCKGFPMQECETNSPARLKDGGKDCTDSQGQHVVGLLDSFTVQDKSSFPILHIGSPSNCASGHLDGLPAIKDDHHEEFPNGGLKGIDRLDDASLLPRPLETDLIASNVDIKQEMVKPSLGTTESKDEAHMMNGLSEVLDHTPYSVPLPTPLLQNSEQDYQVMENSSMDMSVTLSNPDTMSDLESALPQSSELMEGNLCLLKPKEQVENVDDLTDVGDVEAPSLLIQHCSTEKSGNTVTSDLQQYESNQKTDFGSSLEIPSPATCPEVVQESDNRSADLSESSQMMQESCEMSSTSLSPEDVLQDCPAEGCSSTELHMLASSPPCVSAEDSERSKSPILPTHEQPSESLTKDNSDMSMCSVVSTDGPSVLCPSLPLLKKLGQGCQEPNSEEHNLSNVLQDILPESQGEERALQNTCNSPAASVPSETDQACAAEISLPGDHLSKKLDFAQAYQNPEEHNPSVLQDILPERQGEEKALENTCHSPAASVSPVKDRACAAQISLPGDHLSKTLHLAQACQNPDSEEHNPSNVLQDILPERQEEEKALQNTCESAAASVSPVKDQACAAQISLPGDHFSKTLDLAQVCQSPEEQNSSVLQDILPESQGEEKSLQNTCDSAAESVSPVKDQDCAAQISLPGDHLSKTLHLAQACQNPDSEEHNPSNVLQDILPESQEEEKALQNTCESAAASVSPVKDQACVDAAAIPLPGNRSLTIFNSIQACQKNDITTPADYSLAIQPVCHPVDEKESGSSASIMRDDCNACRDAKSLNRMPSPQVLLKDCLKCHCGTYTPSQCLQNTQSNNSASEIGSTSCGVRDTSNIKNVSAHRDAKSPNKMPLPGPQIVLQDCLKCHCITNTQNKHSEDIGSLCGVRDATEGEKVSAHKDDKPLKKTPLPGAQVLLQDCLKCHCGRITPSPSLLNTQALDANSASEVVTDAENISPQSDTHKDRNTVPTAKNTPATPPIESESLISEQKKNYENTILPDLLLDIQPEHRMDDPVSGIPSPACDATASMALPSDMDITKQDVLQKGQVAGCDRETTEVLSDDDSKLADSMETTGISEGLADCGSDSMELGEVVKTPALKRLKMTERPLQWKNKHSLCWLDCILSALVQSKTVRHFVAEGHVGKESIIHSLFTTYDEATALYLKSLKKQKKTVKRPKYEKCLHEFRMGIFEKLKPLLKMKLGKKESPVFAFPLLLNQDSQTEKIYAHSFRWQFKCEACGYSYQQRCQKTLTTFTKVLPEWCPLNAVHKGPCNQCQNTEQKRSMVLEKLNSVFMVHFVEGLPSSDLDAYSFQFQGHSYVVKSIIKYRNNHFSTWISNNNGTWLESDDLRGSFCRRHQKFRVRASDIHIVIWERTDGKIFEDVQLGESEQDSEFKLTCVSMASEEEDSFSSVGAAEPSQQVATTVPPAHPNTSNPLAGMEGYAEDDVITLTLVEIPLDASGQPIEVPADTTQGEGTHTAYPKMSTDIQIKNQENSILTTSISSDSSVEAAPLRDSSVTPSPLNRSSSKPVGEAIATSTPAQKPSKPNWSGVGNWMTRLIKKDDSILNFNLPHGSKKTLPLVTCPPLKVTDPSAPPRKAQNFNGFQGRSKSNTSIFASNISPPNTELKPSFNAPKEMLAPVATPSPTPTTSSFRKPGSSTLEYGKQLIKEGNLSGEDKIRKLRVKLLKKLKAKKNELATLEKLSKMQEGGAFGVQTNGGFNRKEHLKGFLHELQEHIDNADNDSVCTMSSGTSMCSSPGDADFFAELFSPSPVSNQSDDGRYLEMLADGIASVGPLPQTNGHQPASESSNGYPANRDESLNLMSNSTLAVLNEENGCFNFDDYF